MIVKSQPRKAPTFGQLLGYINRADMKGPAILHNFLTGRDRAEEIVPELMENARLLRRRRNGNVLYHEILSFSSSDAADLSPAMIEDLTRRYIHLRCPDALVYARPHFDTNNPHVHLLISANNVGSRERHRLSRQEFSDIKQGLEEYQRQQYPQLCHSIAQDRKGSKVRRREAELDRRLSQAGKRSRKEEVRFDVGRVLQDAKSRDEAVSRLRMLGFRLYCRGSTTGIIDEATGRRFRLETLGFADRFGVLVRGTDDRREHENRLGGLARLRASREAPTLSR